MPSLLTLRKKLQIFKRNKVDSNETVTRTGKSSDKNSVVTGAEGDHKSNNSIAIRKAESAFSSAALKILLDNLVDVNELQEIFDYENKVLLKAKLNLEEECVHCGKYCNARENCCPVKESNLYLLERALQKLNDITDKRSTLVPLEYKALPSPRVEISEDKLKKLKMLHFEHSVPQFLKIQKRLDNMKKFYPRIYYHQDNIIDAWANNEELGPMNRDILDYDENIGKIHWF